MNELSGLDKDGGEGFNVNLNVLDGYVLPPLDKGAESENPEIHKKKRKKRQEPEILGLDYLEREEKRLEELLFGNLLSKLEKNTNFTTEENDFKSTSVDNDKNADLLPQDKFGETLGLTTSEKRQPAWVDEDDVNIRLKDVVAEYSRAPGKHGSKETSETNYKQHLEKNFGSVYGQITPKWAELGSIDAKKKRKKSSDNEEDEEELFPKTAGNILVNGSVNLAQGVIRHTRVVDLNKETHFEGPLLKAVEFHQTESLALVAGSSGVATLVRVDGKTNPKVQSIHFDRFPISCAHFSKNGEEFVASSHLHGHVQAYNLVTGKTTRIPHNKAMEQGNLKKFIMSPDGKYIAFQGRFGYIHLLSGCSKEWISSLKMNGEVRALAFNSDGTRLYSHGDTGEVYIWDMNTRNCVHKFFDDGCISGTSVAVSPTQQYVACGSSSGVVNLYQANKLENNFSPKPDKVLLNLVTSITSVKFHPSSEMMSMASELKDDAVRLVHFPSLTVFSNFPNLRKNSAYRIQTVDFSPNGGYMALGNNHGSAMLFRLHHYDHY